MRFGNSNGKNKGKKYLNRKNLAYDKLTASDYARLDGFNTWYTDSFASIRQSLKSRGIFNEDVVNDTYAEICENILFAKTNIEDYMSYFSQAYFTNRTRSQMNGNKYVLLENENHIERFQQERVEPAEVIEADQELIADIMTYVKRNYPMKEHFLFYQYINMEERSYQALAEHTGRTIYEVQKIIKKIKLDIQANEALRKKRAQSL